MYNVHNVRCVGSVGGTLHKWEIWGKNPNAYIEICFEGAVRRNRDIQCVDFTVCNAHCTLHKQRKEKKQTTYGPSSVFWWSPWWCS